MSSLKKGPEKAAGKGNKNMDLKKMADRVGSRIGNFLGNPIGIREKGQQGLLPLFVCPIITFYLFELYTHNPFTSMNVKTQLLNWIFFELTALLLFAVLPSLRWALLVQTGVFMVIGLANYYVLRFRGAPIMPWDILSAGTAAGVAGNFNYEPEGKTLVILLGFVLLLAAEGFCRQPGPGRKRVRLLLVIVPFFLLQAYADLIQSEEFVRSFGLYDKLFTPAVINKRDGNVVAFLMELEYLDVEKPEGYEAEAQAEIYEELEQAYADRSAALGGKKSPNIIVIMNEAFSDLSVLGSLDTNEDYMPYMRSLMKGADNTVSGYLNVSVLGGNTANTEFEFLTGNSLAFLPQNSVAYQQYLKTPLPTLPGYLKGLGYRTVAMHPYYPDGWERSRVYPLMGFDSFLSLSDFAGSSKVRKYISDDACVDRIIELLEEQKGKEPLFVMNVTMQNHGGYGEDFSNFVPEIKAEGLESRTLDIYLSLVKLSDASLGRLLSRLESWEEETVVVFFGDHQPAAYVSDPILRANGEPAADLSREDVLKKYRVPYVIWSNFDSGEEKDLETSPNYLGGLVLRQCGLPLSPYQSFLEEVREVCPVVSGMLIETGEGERIEPKDVKELREADDAEASLIEEYGRLQYYLLFDYGKEQQKEQ